MGNSQKMVIVEIVYCHGNSLQHTRINDKEIPGVLLIFTANARSLNPKLKQIVHALLVPHPSSGERTVKTVGSHLKTSSYLKSPRFSVVSW